MQFRKIPVDDDDDDDDDISQVEHLICYIPINEMLLKLTFQSGSGLSWSLTSYFCLLRFCRVDVILNEEE